MIIINYKGYDFLFNCIATKITNYSLILLQLLELSLESLEEG